MRGVSAKALRQEQAGVLQEEKVIQNGQNTASKAKSSRAIQGPDHARGGVWIFF